MSLDHSKSADEAWQELCRLLAEAEADFQRGDRGVLVAAIRRHLSPESVDCLQVAPGEEMPFALSPGEEQELSAALAEIDAGRQVDGWALLKRVKAESRE